MSDFRPALDDLLTKTVDQSTWQSALKPALDGLDAEHAAWRPAERRNSIHMIVRHLNLWKGAVLADLRGAAPNLREVSATDWRAIDADAELWTHDLAELERLAQEVRAAAADPALERQLPAFGTTLGLTLMYLANHDAYHTGQIMVLRRLQGL